MGRSKFAARCREVGVRFPMVVFSARAWREGSRDAESPSFKQAGMQESTAAENARRRLRTLNPLILAVSLKAGIERSTVENARQRQKTLYPLVSSKARRGTIDCQECSAEAKNECSTPLETRFALGSGAGSVLQTQRIRMLVGERSEIFLKRLSFYIVKIACFPALLGFVR